MIIGTRQAFIGCASVPEIKHQDKTDIKGYETIVKVFEEALMLKQCYYYEHKEFRKEKIYKEIIDRDRKMYNDCLRQTIHFLKSIKALKNTKKIKSIKLWQKAVKMQPFYEGINGQLKTTLIKQHCPEMHKAISKGACYSHQTLTDIGEAVLYVMEYFTKEKVLINADVVVKNKEVERWVKSSSRVG